MAELIHCWSPTACPALDAPNRAPDSVGENVPITVRTSPHLQEEGHGVNAQESGRSARRQWTQDDENQLRSLVETHAIDQAASVLGRSVEAVRVRVRASRLGLVWMIGTGGRLVRHARRLVFQLAEVLVSREMLGGILERIGRLRLAPG